MERSIKIFKSLEEQERFNEQQMISTSAFQRFRKLYQMQEFTRLLRPSSDKTRKITIRKWIS
jgi:hypothetical protein